MDCNTAFLTASLKHDFFEFVSNPTVCMHLIALFNKASIQVAPHVFVDETQKQNTTMKQQINSQLKSEIASILTKNFEIIHFE